MENIKFEEIEVIRPSVGILRYSAGEPLNLRVEIDPEIAGYYRSLIPKWIRIRKQLYSPHISVVRKEKVPHVSLWGKYEGLEVPFDYSNIVKFGAVYCWLNVFSVRLEEIRQELGLRVDSPYTRPPEGFLKCFHTTLANFKNV